MRKVVLFTILMFLPTVSFAETPFDNLSLAVGIQEHWLSSPDYRAVEAVGSAILPVTGHIAATGAFAYGFEGAYGRGAVDGRFMVTDGYDTNLKLWLGAGRFFSDDPSEGLNEWALSSGVEYKPFSRLPATVAFTIGYGVDSERRDLALSASYPFRLSRQ